MSDDVQINVQDLLAAFAQENASLTQRAILAEQRAKAYQSAVTRLQQEQGERTTAVPDPTAYRQGLEDGWNGAKGGLSFEEVTGGVIRGVDDVAVTEVKAPARRGPRKRAS
jgi:hypothetical protein